MKKIITGVLALFMSATIVLAQEPAKPTQEKQKAEHRNDKKDGKPELDKDGKPVRKDKDGKPELGKDGKPVKKDGKPEGGEGPKKKDGTPDKRFKENKEPKGEGPKKKDGTPDKRFKENKEPKKEETKS